MNVINYTAPDVGAQIDQEIESKKPFGLRISGWRSSVIKAGLPYYIRYRDAVDHGKRDPLVGLLVIPFGFVTPTFWMTCVRTEFNKQLPRVDTASGSFIVVFEQRLEAPKDA